MPRAITNCAMPKVFAAAGAARIVDERDCSKHFDEALASTLAELLSNSAQRRAMSSAMLKQSRPDARLAGGDDDF